MKKKYIYKFKKSIKKNIFNIITSVVAIIGLIISIISLNQSILESKRNTLPNIVVGTLENIIENHYHSTLDYYELYSKEINTKVKISNLGSGISKNIEFIWNEENRDNFLSIIKNVDKKNLVTFKDNYPILSFDLCYSGGGINISKNHYKYNIDYLLPEKSDKSNEYLYFPYEYISYLKILTNLSLKYNFDINEILKDTKIYLDITYEDVDNNTYKKTIPFEVNFDITTIKDKKVIFYMNIHNNL